jgi:hypothetical protein
MTTTPAALDAAPDADLQAELATLKGRLMRLEAAEAAGLPLRLADRLNGDTPDLLEADAVAFAGALIEHAERGS